MPIIQKSARGQLVNEVWQRHYKLTMDSNKVEVGMLGGE